MKSKENTQKQLTIEGVLYEKVSYYHSVHHDMSYGGGGGPW